MIIKFLTVERNAAIVLLLSAIAGLLAYNVGFSGAIDAARDTHFSVAGIGLDLNVDQWLGEFFIAFFFLLVGLELKREFVSGVFKNRSAIAIPAFAATFGAIVPAIIYFAMTNGITVDGQSVSAGWALPMATDVTFAVAVFAVFGSAYGKSARTFLLSFAVIDDVIAILVIAIFLGGGLKIEWMLAALASVGLFALVTAQGTKAGRAARIGAIRFVYPLLAVVLALAAWYFTHESGIAPAVMGVVLGLAVPASKLESLAHRLQPWVMLGILPVFAFFASSVSLGAGLAVTSAMTIAILLRPIGKMIGINLGVVTAKALVKSDSFSDLRTSDYVRLSILGGIGFTVALLIAGSVFGTGTPLANEAVVATLAAMVLSMVLGAIVLATKRKAKN
jgi:NhaA family Na+:H+ antiporter